MAIDRDSSSSLSPPLVDVEEQDQETTTPQKRKRAVKNPEAKPTRTNKRQKVKQEEEDEQDRETAVPRVAQDTPKGSAAKAKKSNKEAPKPEPEDSNKQEDNKDPKTKPKRSRKPKVKSEHSDNEAQEAEAEPHSETEEKPKSKRQHKSKPASTSQPETNNDTKTPPKRKRKTAEEKAAEAMPLAPRTPNQLYNIGAHVSAAGGVHNAITNAVHIGANSLALFLKSQRKWANPALKPEHSDLFRSACATHKYDASKHALPHGSYLVNLAHSDLARKTQAYESFLDDLQRCETLGIRFYNFHPGNTANAPRGEAIANLAAHINKALAVTSKVTLLLETMATASASNTLGGAGFTDLRDTIALVEDKSRIGVCLDTCHVFAAGHDLRSPDAFAKTMQQFDEVVGAKYIKALHLNDSKAPLGSHRDLHANIGSGFLGLRAFWNVMNYVPFRGLPMVLETPIEVPDLKAPEGEAKSKVAMVQEKAEEEEEEGDDAESPKKGKKVRPKGPKAGPKTIEDKGIWAREIKLLESLVGMDVESEEFKKLEAKLADRGKESRAKHMEQFERKTAEMEKKAKAGAKKSRKTKTSGEAKGKRKGAEESTSELSDVEESDANESDEEEKRESPALPA